ncbi:MAG: RNA polymerase sigma factor (TIGR02999 family) [Planctomycetota bacterium]|jgi:RNA polymerase sigma factor (TIGR02999 family)
MEDETLATQLLDALEKGDPDAREALLAMVYDELKSLARRYMAGERASHTLQATALVNEAWMRLMPVKEGASAESESWESRGHFLRVAASAMRNVLVDHARSRTAQKRGDGREQVPLDQMLAQYEERSLDPIAIDAALDKLNAMDEQLAKIVELRFFAGLTIAETAGALGVSTPTIERGWRVARMWLRTEIPGVNPDDTE